MVGPDLQPVWISLKTALTATVITTVLGVAAAYWVTSLQGFKKGVLDGIFLLPLVLPPTVIGFILLIIFGKHGPVGKILALLGKNIIFSWPATVIAAVVVAFPLMYQTSRGAFAQIDHNLESAARTLGASEWRVFRQIMLPLAWPGLAAGMILSFARALGEFGATLMLAGNIPGKTQTIPLAIYFAFEGGDMEKATYLSMIISVVSLLMVVILNCLNKSKNSK